MNHPPTSHSASAAPTAKPIPAALPLPSPATAAPAPASSADACEHAARYDPPPALPAAGLEHVLDNVENLAHGIDAMLRSASESSIGSIDVQSAKAALDADAELAVEAEESADAQDADVGDDDDDDDDEMMRVFDEDEPSDIHAIDRMLAQQAQGLIERDLPMPEPVEGAAALDDPPRESIERLAVAAVEAQAAVESIEREQADAPDVLAVIGEPKMNHPAAGVERDQPAAKGDQPEPHASIGAGEPNAPEEDPLEAATAGASKAPAAVEPKPRAKRSPAAALLCVALMPAVETLAVINLPLRLAPASIKPLVNVLAITLAMWAPVVWYAGPRLGERVVSTAVAVDAAADNPAHQHSSLRNDRAAGAGANHGGGH